MLHVVTLLWDHNPRSQWFSRCYDEQWVERLFAGFRRNLSIPFQPVLFTDHRRPVDKKIMQVLLTTESPEYGNCIEPFRLGVPMMLCGLDTVVVGNCDPLADYCLTADRIALPRDPYHPHRACNGVCLVPAGQRAIYDEWNGENDMEWLRTRPHVMIDQPFPGLVESYKGKIKKDGLGDCRIVYHHGDEKPHQLTDQAWIKQHWLGSA